MNASRQFLVQFQGGLASACSIVSKCLPSFRTVCNWAFEPFKTIVGNSEFVFHVFHLFHFGRVSAATCWGSVETSLCFCHLYLLGETQETRLVELQRPVVGCLVFGGFAVVWLGEVDATSSLLAACRWEKHAETLEMPGSPMAVSSSLHPGLCTHVVPAAP